MVSRIFIERPRLAVVLSIIITLAGLIALFNIPVSQYPSITPPVIRVSAVYPGANAKVVADTVAAPIDALHVVELLQQRTLQPLCHFRRGHGP